MLVFALAIVGRADGANSDPLVPINNGGLAATGWLNTAGEQCVVDGTNCFGDVADPSTATYIRKGTQTNLDITFDLNLSTIPDTSVITAISVTFTCSGAVGANTSQVQSLRRVGGVVTASGINVTCPNTADGSPFTQNHTGLSITKAADTDIEIGIRGTQNRAVSITALSAVITYQLTPSGTGALVPTNNGGLAATGWLNTASEQCVVDGTNCFGDVADPSTATYIRKGLEASGLDITFDLDILGIPNTSVITGISVTFTCSGAVGNNTSTVQSLRRVGGVVTASGINVTCPNTAAGSPFTQNHTGLSITKAADTDLEIGIRSTQNRAVRITALTATITYTPPAPTNTVLPVISGNTLLGDTLTSSTGTWTYSPVWYTYQWLRCDSAGAACTNIGANQNTYLLTVADVGSTIRTDVVAINAGGSSTPARSAATQVVKRAQTTAVVVTGPVRVHFGETATATATGGDGTGAYVFSHGSSTGCSVSGTTVSVSDASGTC
ncbi:MAG: hypothetical protein Q8N51_12050, partial [Gammaproteobacteria bacterium]|nr:hypothetical protein [Gammaproteobacteria bacterium]